jgi:methionine-rich copper-binding protein CopC
MLFALSRPTRLAAVGVLLAAWAVVMTLLGAPAASAHSQLISVSPADGTTVPTAPSEVVLTFNEDVNPQFVTVRVTDAEGAALTTPAPAVRGAVVTQSLPDGLLAGDYKVTFRVVSKDSHPIAGSSHFIIAGDPQAAATTAAPSPTEGASPAASPTGRVSSPDPHPSASPRVSSPDPVPSAPSTTSGDGGGIPAWAWLALVAAAVVAVGVALTARGRQRG